MSRRDPEGAALISFPRLGWHPLHSLPAAISVGSLRSISFYQSSWKRKATRELLKPGGLSGELPAETPVPFTLWEIDATTILVRRRDDAIKSGRTSGVN